MHRLRAADAVSPRHRDEYSGDRASPNTHQHWMSHRDCVGMIPAVVVEEQSAAEQEFAEEQSNLSAPSPCVRIGHRACIAAKHICTSTAASAAPNLFNAKWHEHQCNLAAQRITTTKRQPRAQGERCTASLCTDTAPCCTAPCCYKAPCYTALDVMKNVSALYCRACHASDCGALGISSSMAQG